MLNNTLLTISGSVIGSSGAILTWIMCKAMNRSLNNVIFGSYADLAVSAGPGADIDRTHTETSAHEVTELLTEASEVIIVPG